MNKNRILSLIFLLIAVPLTIFAGVRFLGDRKFYFISTLIILETLFPFFVSFENKKVSPGELVIISVLCALGIGGRIAFSFVPFFKPMVAIVIISAISFGGETGFLIGCIIGFVSNFFFGQGPWTPWEMVALGSVGLVSGILFKFRLLPKNRIILSVFGFFVTVLIYGAVVNTSMLTYQPNPNLKAVLAIYIQGLPFDCVHGISTFVFMFLLAKPMFEKLDRIKSKYGI